MLSRGRLRLVCPRNPRQELSQCLHQPLIRLLGRLSSSSLIWPEAIWTVMLLGLFGSFGRFLNEVAPAESVAQTRPPGQAPHEYWLRQEIRAPPARKRLTEQSASTILPSEQRG